ncbi:hypothetical protein [Bradyrhizobium sp. AZCC 1693]|uniref:hypothetical protein n=1 Tax=Bradyrhizobium sp. AZCC 1693 TaxID=3117029 RepID=UPI002FF4220C
MAHSSQLILLLARQFGSTVGLCIFACGTSLDRAAGTSGSYTPECYRSGKRSGSRANRAAIIAAMNDPLAVRCLPGNDADMVRPDHHHADSGAAGIHAFARPGACKRKATVRFAKIFAQVTAAPGVRPVTVMPVMGPRFGLNGKDEQKRGRDKEGFQHDCSRERW